MSKDGDGHKHHFRPVNLHRLEDQQPDQLSPVQQEDFVDTGTYESKSPPVQRRITRKEQARQGGM
eukprot:4494160-Prorocentrum_lima.AAC.1